MIPKTYLPFPWWCRWIWQIGSWVGGLLGWGFWYWERETDTLFMNSQQCRNVGCDGHPWAVGRIDMLERRLWDDQQRELLRDALEFSIGDDLKFKHYYFVRHDDGAQQLMMSIGHWRFRDDAEQPYAMYGWTKIVYPDDDAMECITNEMHIKAEIHESRAQGCVSQYLRRLGKILSHHGGK